MLRHSSAGSGACSRSAASTASIDPLRSPAGWLSLPGSRDSYHPRFRRLVRHPQLTEQPGDLPLRLAPVRSADRDDHRGLPEDPERKAGRSRRHDILGIGPQIGIALAVLAIGVGLVVFRTIGRVMGLLGTVALAGLTVTALDYVIDWGTLSRASIQPARRTRGPQLTTFLALPSLDIHELFKRPSNRA